MRRQNGSIGPDPQLQPKPETAEAAFGLAAQKLEQTRLQIRKIGLANIVRHRPTRSGDCYAEPRASLQDEGCATDIVDRQIGARQQNPQRLIRRVR